ncbi:hypothetical protein J6590_072409 [Homalodisca vitripennis]|nr:hypothetical protein J6590_072409 [Homalodisca vitripennis]
MLGFNRVPVSAVNGMVRRVCPMVTTEKLNALALPALLYRHPTGVYVLLFISSGTRPAPSKGSPTAHHTDAQQQASSLQTNEAQRKQQVSYPEVLRLLPRREA